MFRILVKQALQRRKKNVLQYICIMASIISNIVFILLSGNILYSLFVTLNSDWHKNNNQYMQSQVGDIFFGNKSDMVYKFTILLCIMIIVVSFILIIFFNKMWRKEIEALIKINKYIGFNRSMLSLIALFELVADYIISIPFVFIIATVVWKMLLNKNIFYKIIMNAGGEDKLQMFIFILIYCVVLLVATIQNGAWIRKIIN